MTTKIKSHIDIIAEEKESGDWWKKQPERCAKKAPAPKGCGTKTYSEGQWCTGGWTSPYSDD